MANDGIGDVFLLWFVHQFEDGGEDELLIGVYRTEDDAKAAIERLRTRQGFAEHPKWFQIEKYELNKDHWTEGYKTVERGSL